jgi:hypothetical protein
MAFPHVFHTPGTTMLDATHRISSDLIGTSMLSPKLGEIIGRVLFFSLLEFWS